MKILSLRVFTVVILSCVTLIVVKYVLYEDNIDSGEMMRTRMNSEFINPLLRNGTVVKKHSYLRKIEKMSPGEINKLILQFNIKGTHYLTSRAKREFLWCDSEIRSKIPVHERIQACTEMTFQRDTGRRVALASFPGSGSTWSRTLLEQATGIYTGAIYCDKKLKGQGFLGEQITNGNVIVIKTHSSLGPRNNYEATIFLIRNIFDAVKSEINRLGSGRRNHTGVLDIDDYDSKKLYIYF